MANRMDFSSNSVTAEPRPIVEIPRYAHESESARFWNGKHRLERQGTKTFTFSVSDSSQKEFIGC